jgi:hypothetical protein
MVWLPAAGWLPIGVLLADTLVVWGGEFGRTPVSETGDGRDHNHYGFTTVLAGGGVKGGTAYGATFLAPFPPRRTVPTQPVASAGLAPVGYRDGVRAAG